MSSFSEYFTFEQSASPLAPPYTRSKAQYAGQDGTLQTTYTASQSPSRPISRKRRRQPEFSIFIDATATENHPQPTPKRLKNGPRTPLSVRSDFGNSTPAPSPRLPATPFPSSPDDSFWQNLENYNPNPIITPPPTPVPTSLSPSPATNPPPPPPQTSRITPSTIATRLRPLLPPQNMVLYGILGLESWRVTKTQILVAWRQVALDVHPDHFGDEDREAATLEMQKVNAAKDVLSDFRSRRRYHETGALPWAE